MRFVPKVLPKISPTHIWLGVAAFFAFMTVITVLSNLLSDSKPLIEEALISGQRIEYNIKTGEVSGEVKYTQKQQEEADDDSDEDSKGKKKKKRKKRKKGDFGNFIGPRLPKELLEAILEKNTQTVIRKRKEVTVEDLGGKPVIVILLQGLGLSASTTEDALNLPENITLGFSPYAPSVKEWALAARDEGHEILISIPMETKDFRVDDPGPYALTSKFSKDDNVTRLNMLLGLFEGYVGAYSKPGEVFSNSLISIRPVLKRLHEKDVPFLFGNGYSHSSAIQLADQIGYPMLVSDMILDDGISQYEINQSFRKLEKLATEKSYVIVIAHPYPLTIRMLERWLSDVNERGYNVQPLSFILEKVYGYKYDDEEEEEE
ncbi:divergent polysaccharide deacetylase family protein [Rickettsiales bacterium]|nr:divergent polysaccharide deacetylase family protein [Rickettsiales bacterium]